MRKETRLWNRLLVLCCALLLALPLTAAAQGEEGEGETEGTTDEGTVETPPAPEPPPAPEAAVEPAAEPPAEAPAPEAKKEVEEIIVTGTRIGRSNLEEFAHITVLTSKDIALSGVTTVDDLLTTMPSVTLQGVSKQNNNGGNGLAFVDLRNLGVSRTLVLVNGRRFIKSSTGAGVDLNNIPVSMIERVEVLLDGASAAYGSDAIGGVINIILKDNIDGFEAELSGGITPRGDGSELTASLTGGTVGDRGSVAANFTYGHRDHIAQKDRSWAHYPVGWEYFDDNGIVIRGYGSGTHQGGRFLSGDIDGNDIDVFFNPDGSPSPFIDNECPADVSGGDCMAQGSRYNYGNDQWLVGDMERFSTTVLGKYDLSENVRSYLEGTYTKRWSRNQLAPQPLGFGTNAYPDLWVPTTNPYMPQSLRDSIDPGLGGGWLLMRPTQLGERIYDNDSQTFRMVAGVKGDITEDIGWDFYLNYGHHQNMITIYNSVNMRRAVEVADPDLCNSPAAQAAGCVVANYFGEGNLSQAVIDYIRYTDIETTSWDMFQLGATVNGKLFELPGGPFGAALGFETRKESGYNRPSPVTIGNEASGNGLDPTQGSYNAQEVFAEVSLPLLKELPAVEALTIDLAARFSHYNTFGNDLTYRAGLSWSPIRDLRLRGVYSTAFRAPDIGDLYGGAADSYEQVSDPCNEWGNNPDATIRANCQAQGVPPDYNQNDAGGTQIRTNIGGNPTLDAETAQVINGGLVFTPSFLPEYLKTLSATLDFYYVTVDNAITSPTPQWVLDTCYTSEGMSHPICQNIGARNTNHVITFMDASLQNYAQIETMGLDFTINYGIVGDMVGLPKWLRFDIGFHGNYLLAYNEQSKAEPEPIDYEGTITSNLSGGTFAHLRWVLNLVLSGEQWAFGNRVRYIGPADIFGFDPEIDPHASVPAVAYWDIFAQYTWNGFDFIVGADNVMDKAPPFMVGGENGNLNTYDFIGTYFYAKVGYKF